MPRARPRRRRRRKTADPQTINSQPPTDGQFEATPQRRRLPTAGVVTAMGLGMWLGWVFSAAGGAVETIFLWVGVLMAGLGGGRLLRRWLQSRQKR